MPAVSPPAGDHRGHGTPAPLLECATGMAQAGMGHGSAHAATAMMGAHVAATALMAALLAYGEQVLWFLAGFVRPPLWLRVSLPELQGTRVVPSCEPRMFHMRFACGGVGQRGPPSTALFAIV